MPRLASLSWFERRYVVDGKTKQKHALWAELSAHGGPLFTAVSFHLETAGGHRQRAAQVAALAAALAERGLERRLLCCGDTNAFSWRRDRRALDDLLAPFAAFGASDPETRPTHHFARQNEPMLHIASGSRSASWGSTSRCATTSSAPISPSKGAAR